MRNRSKPPWFVTLSGEHLPEQEDVLVFETKEPKNPGAHIMRFLIDILRQAQFDYLHPKSKKKVRRSAWDALFGLSQSMPFSRTCEFLGIDPVAAKLAIIRLRLRGEMGDPVFGFLFDEESLDKVLYGRTLEHPTLETLAEDGGCIDCRYLSRRKNSGSGR